jgi:hypothetical protein
MNRYYATHGTVFGRLFLHFRRFFEKKHPPRGENEPFKNKNSPKAKDFWESCQRQNKKNKKKGPLSIFVVFYRKYTKNGQLFPK